MQLISVRNKERQTFHIGDLLSEHCCLVTLQSHSVYAILVSCRFLQPYGIVCSPCCEIISCICGSAEAVQYFTKHMRICSLSLSSARSMLFEGRYVWPNESRITAGARMHAPRKPFSSILNDWRLVLRALHWQIWPVAIFDKLQYLLK